MNSRGRRCQERAISRRIRKQQAAKIEKLRRQAIHDSKIKNQGEKRD